jgi:hypothetical protein
VGLEAILKAWGGMGRESSPGDQVGDAAVVILPRTMESADDLHFQWTEARRLGIPWNTYLKMTPAEQRKAGARI